MQELYHDSPDDSLPTPTKKCNRCKIEKPLSEFYNDKHKRDGHSTLCKQCILDPHKPIVQLPLIIFELTCNRCGETKPINEFYEANGTRSGYTKQCKQCHCKQVSDHWKATYVPKQPKPREKPQAAPGMKICGKCHEEKPLEAFGLCKSSKDGLEPACMACLPDRHKTGKRRNWQKPTEQGTKICTGCGLEKPLEEYHFKCKKDQTYVAQCKTCVHEAYAVWYETSDKEQARIRNHEWYVNNTERHRELAKEWLEQHPYFVAERNRRFNARRRQAYIEPVDYAAILVRDGFWCYLCEDFIDPNAKRKSRGGLTFDHVIPLDPRPSEPQGFHTEDNIRPAHHVCNVRKSNIPFELLTLWHRRGLVD